MSSSYLVRRGFNSFPVRVSMVWIWVILLVRNQEANKGLNEIQDISGETWMKASVDKSVGDNGNRRMSMSSSRMLLFFSGKVFSAGYIY